jgi:putative transposase
MPRALRGFSFGGASFDGQPDLRESRGVLLESILWWSCQWLLSLLHLVQATRRRLDRARLRWGRTLARVLRRLGGRVRGRAGPRRGGHNRTSSATEWAVLRPHVDCPHVGIRGLATLLARVEGIALSASTIHAILRRRRDDLAELEAVRRGRPRTIVVPVRMLRWGLDLTLVWVMGVVPVWVIAVVDLHSSRLLALRPVSPTSVGVVDVLEQLFEQHGRPSAVMTDNGGQFGAGRFRAALRHAGVRHLRIRPGHPWTNGKTERVFRTVKELQRFYAPVLVSLVHAREFCRDAMTFYNHCRPHSAHWGLTPDERDAGRPWQPVLRRESFFDGQLLAYRFT